MKKEYVAPSAEKLTFDYTESVVASGSGSDNQEKQEQDEHQHQGPTYFAWWPVCWKIWW